MNFLAHCALADDAASAWQADAAQRAGILAGAVIGDFTKGTLSDIPTELRAGIRVHRRIDAISNRDTHLSNLAGLYPKSLERYAPIFVDLLIDHALARTWHTFYPEDVTVFSAEAYAAIERYQRYLPKPGRRFFDYMQEVDLLPGYADEQHLLRGLHSVMRRLNRSTLSAAVTTVEQATLAAVDQTLTNLPTLYPPYRQYWSQWSTTEDFLASIEQR